MFVRNSWYVAGWSREINNEKPVGRTILNEPIVLFRTRQGNVAALSGRCAHRWMPLEHGKIVDDTIVCCYHGLTYGETGECVRIPGQKVIPKNVKLRRYPTVERYGAVWIWMGDPAIADEVKIFKCPALERGAKESQHQFYFHVKANYLYLNDNLSDLLHQAYLHNPSFGGNTHSLGEIVPTVKQTGQGILVSWDWDNVPVPGLFGDVGKIKKLADGWNHSTFQAPSFYINSVGFADAGTGKIDSQCRQGDGKLTLIIHQLITPETPRSTHFFKIVYCEWPDALLPKLPLFINNVNEEDIWACEEQQRMEDLDSTIPMSAIQTDTAVIAMRRTLGQMYESEQARTSK